MENVDDDIVNIQEEEKNPVRKTHAEIGEKLNSWNKMYGFFTFCKNNKAKLTYPEKRIALSSI